MEGLSCFGWTSSGGGGGGGSVTGANNGLHLFGSIVQMGGAFILPTTITATNVNYLDVVDAYGSFLKTRDALNNFSIADFGGNAFVGTNTNIFSYLAQSNTYDNSNILYNIGSNGNYVSAIDTWNFGDFNTYDSTNITFTLGRSNTYGTTIDAYVFGNSNTLNNGTTIRVVGNDNVVGGGNAFIYGHNNNFSSGQGVYLFGRNANIDDTFLGFGNGDIFSLGTFLTITGGSNVDSIINIGFANSINVIAQTRGVYIMGDSHSINDFVTYSTLIGENCYYERVDHASSFGIGNTLSDVTFSYIFGESNTLILSNSITNIGVSNSIDGCTNILNIGNGNGISSINNAVIIGLGNINALSSEILIAQNDLGIRVDINGDVGIGVPYTQTINSRNHIKGVETTTLSNQRLEPVNGVYEDTTGATIATNDATVTPLETIPIPFDTVLMIESYITCRKTSGGDIKTIGKGNGYIRTVKAQNIGGVVTIGVIQSSFTSESITDYDSTFTVSGTNVVINVTGALNDNVTWNSITKKYNV